MTYAKGTKTSIENSEQQIKTMLRKAGADAVAMFEERTRAVIGFHLNGLAIQFRLPLPAKDDPKFLYKPVFGRVGDTLHPKATQEALWVQACRERWRALHLCIKAKLEAVEQNIETFEEAFLSHIQTPDGRTVGDQVIPELKAQLAGKPPRALLPPPGNH